MKRFVCFCMLAAALCGVSLAGNVSKNLSKGVFENRPVLGISVDASMWLEPQPEPLWHVGSELLIPCTKRLSLGAFAGSSFYMWDAGVLAGWRLPGECRLMAGLGYSATYDTPLLRLAFKTRSRWYVTGSLGRDTRYGDWNASLGVGFSIIH